MTILSKRFGELVLDLLDQHASRLLGAIQDGRVVLGGSAGSDGGVGGPPAGFWGQLAQRNITYDLDGATRACSAGSAGSDSIVDNLDRIRLGWEICDDAITEDHINWGHGAGQVSAVDVPFQSSSGSIEATNVRGAIEEVYGGGGGGGVGAHNILSASHPDTNPATCEPGAMIRGSSGSNWERLTAGDTGQILGIDSDGQPSWTRQVGGDGWLITWEYS